ncbi:hypothetical protein BABINDRAFT_9882 [Babjeviella inositovora NRRL Y-12698]|uniref:Dynamin-type G domain-containing protein n=1 Tax=Babjeviella inositovora NRRL Y-12698 TaxID=984486 RepID=A0A1E3QJV6_9ASCO|nr:uncharacterized protein BABINDRAFT_9882 [Babjeviella inositovora NRRL Y-12698]ODQ77908.1 hypothetical protein BABINDRAFT_9882 [Babjeviella inositovora NRRL Y-12698]
MSSFSDLIPVVNKLQDIVTNTQLLDLDLPILSVIGSQSCGKSSVLENIVGRDFLPRGTGIVTRRPLVLQLINISPEQPDYQKFLDRQLQEVQNGAPGELTLEDHLRNSSPSLEGHSVPPSDEGELLEWGEFLHLPNKRFYNFDDIRREIENETARIAGKNKGISRLPINLKIFSTKVLNLTLVDLPGLTKIPIGDQPTDIERQTRNLILEYIAKPNCVILAVSPANVDLVNSESLKLARQVDPQGKRTVGLLTKLDLMDQGTNAVDILNGRVYPLKLGFVGIVNRSQQDISANKPLGDSLLAEEQFFSNHPAYSKIALKCGTKNLSKKLNNILMNHIRERLPDIKAKLNTLMGQTEQELRSYGEDNLLDADIATKGSLILQLMTKFANNFINSIDGNNYQSTRELCGGARIYYIYNEVFGRSLNSINPVINLSIASIRTAIRNSTGPRPLLFVPELAFYLLVKPQIKLLEAPSKRVVELVYEELMKITHNNCGGPELLRYPKLHSKLIEVVSELLRERLGPTTTYVESIIDIHRAYINTNHPNFIGAPQAMQEVAEERQRMRAEKKTKPVIMVEEEVEALANGSIYEPKKRTVSSVEAKEKDSFLNYFFSKENQKSDELTQTRGQNLHQQPEYKPFQFPTEADTLQFHDPNQLEFGKLDVKAAAGDEAFSEELTEREELECELIRRLISSYFTIIREMIQDQVPKSTMFLLVNFCKDEIQNRLVSKLYNVDKFDDLLMEDAGLMNERAKLVTLLESYRQAMAVIGDLNGSSDYPIVMVKNLPYETTLSELYGMFGVYGAIIQVRKGNTPSTRGTCLVVYNSLKAAKAANDRLQGVNFKGRYVTTLMYGVDRTKLKAEELETRKDILGKLKDQYGIE